MITMEEIYKKCRDTGKDGGYGWKDSDLLQRDLELVHGTGKNPKANLLFAKAWELGHSSGYHEVVIYYNDLVELIK